MLFRNQFCIHQETETNQIGIGIGNVDRNGLSEERGQRTKTCINCGWRHYYAFLPFQEDKGQIGLFSTLSFKLYWFQVMILIIRRKYFLHVGYIFRARERRFRPFLFTRSFVCSRWLSLADRMLSASSWFQVGSKDGMLSVLLYSYEGTIPQRSQMTP